MDNLRIQHSHEPNPLAQRNECNDISVCVKHRNAAIMKWDVAQTMFGQDDLLPMWIADMNVAAPPSQSYRPPEPAVHELTYDEGHFD